MFSVFKTYKMLPNEDKGFIREGQPYHDQMTC